MKKLLSCILLSAVLLLSDNAWGGYLTFTNVDTKDVTIELKRYHQVPYTSNPTPDMSYLKEGDTDWTDWDGNGYKALSLPAGASVQLKGVNPNGISKSESYCCYFAMSGKIEASGNIMSLIDGQEDGTKTIPCNYCFYQLFTECKSLLTAPELPAETLTKGCYYKMFDQCNALRKAPVLPAKTLVDECYYQMFYMCDSLRYIKCLATSIPKNKDCVTNWLGWTASTGMYVIDKTAKCWGRSDFPASGWTKYVCETYARDITLIDDMTLGTLCLPGSVDESEIPSGSKFYEFVGYKGQKVYFEEFTGDSLKAGYPYLFNTSKSPLSFSYNYKSDSKMATPVATTGLIGVFSETTISTDPDNIYLLSDNTLTQAKAGSEVPAYSAYIDLNGVAPLSDEPSSGSLLTLTIDVPYTPTGMNQVAGDRLQVADAEKRMVNGQLIIIRDGKMFSIQGVEL